MPISGSISFEAPPTDYNTKMNESETYNREPTTGCCSTDTQKVLADYGVLGSRFKLSSRFILTPTEVHLII